MAGNITEYDLPPGTDPSGIAASAGAMWFTEHTANQIGRIPTSASVTAVRAHRRRAVGHHVGSDGALWFTETLANKIGRMTTTGAFTEFAIPTPGSEPGDIAAGPDGALWFTEYRGNNIARIEVGSTYVPSSNSPLQPVLPTTTKSAPAKPACRVPAVRGMTVRKALKRMKRAGCRYRVRGKGKVVSTKPRAGSRTTQRVELRARLKRRR